MTIIRTYETSASCLALYVLVPTHIHGHGNKDHDEVEAVQPGILGKAIGDEG